MTRQPLRSGIGLHPNQCRQSIPEELQETVASKFPVANDRTIGIGARDMEDVLATVNSVD
jgi:hypothetical protein